MCGPVGAACPPPRFPPPAGGVCGACCWAASVAHSSATPIDRNSPRGLIALLHIPPEGGHDRSANRQRRVRGRAVLSASSALSAAKLLVRVFCLNRRLLPL